MKATGKYTGRFNKGMIKHRYATKPEKIKPNKGVKKLIIKKQNKKGIRNFLIENLRNTP